MQLRSPAAVFLLVVIGLVAACTRVAPVPPGQKNSPPADDPHATGLRPPTGEERDRLDALATKNPPQTPNELARARLNAERAAKGLPPLPPETPTPPPSASPK